MSMPPRDDLLARLRGVAGGALVAVVMLWSQAVPAPADDPYQLWSHGHPQEALPALLAEAQSSDRWDAWLDLGLAAAAAHDSGRAIAWLLLAHERAPERDEPREALRALGIELPDSWFTRLGPLAWPGCGWPAMLLMVVAGLAFGYACLAPARRAALALSGAGICALIAPGQFALEAELRHPLIAAVRDTRLLDSTGTPGALVPMGTVAVRDAQTPWSGRVLVILPNGSRGYLPIADTIADAPPAGQAP